MPTPLRRSSRVKELEQNKMMMKRKASVTLAKGLKKRIVQAKIVGSKQSGTSMLLARRRLDFEPATLHDDPVSASGSAPSAPHTFQRGSCIHTYHRRGFKLMPHKATPKSDDRITKQGAAAKKMSTTVTKLNTRRMMDNQDSASASAPSTHTTPQKAERTPRRLQKISLRLKVEKDKAATPARVQNKPRGGMERKTRQGTELATVPYQKSPTGRSPSARLRVDLDDDSLRVYHALLQWEKGYSESFEGLNIGSGPEWHKTRQDFQVLIYEFIAAVRCLFGNYS
jgi:hypothetical protein